MKIRHSYHIVEMSPWPITVAISIGSMIIGNVLIYSNIKLGGEIMILAIGSLGYSISKWIKEIIIESTYKGEHTEKVQKGITIGYILFIISEICVFFALFFAYFYNSLVPSVEIGGIWPPLGIIGVDYKSVPLLNTIILLTSGFTITACHNYIINRNYINSINYLILTIGLGLIFLYFQYFEYYNSFFTISDSVFGSSFFLLTGAHGLHIILGVLFLSFTFFRFPHFSSHHHLQFSAASIYWHFLDAVWLFLFFILYCWAS